MPIRKISLDKIERIGLYVSLLLFIVLQTISIAFPIINNIIPQQTPLLFLGIILILFIHHITRLIERPRLKECIKYHSNFTNAFTEFYSINKKIKELCIVAYTSATWFEHIRLAHYKIENLRLLLFYDDELRQKNSKEKIRNFSSYLERIISHWNYLVNDQKIENFELRKIKMAAPFYFGIINRHSELLGLLWPRSGLSGLEPRLTITMVSDVERIREIIEHQLQWFDSMWNVATYITKSSSV